MTLRHRARTAVACIACIAFAIGCGDDTGAADAGLVVDAGVRDAAPFRWAGGFGPRPDASFDYPLDDTLSLFHVQLEATHNSYHLRPANTVIDWQYSHAPLDVQLEEQGVRGLELDLNWDASLGAHRVFHLARVDALSTCSLFVECLTVVRRWSDAHADHTPLVIHLELKDATPDGTHEARMLRIENEIRSVWPVDLIITPDRVRAGYASLPEALADTGWPTLGETRGQVLFALDETGLLRDVYTHGGTSLDGRLMFVDSAPGDAFGAYAIVNDPFATERVDAALAAGFLVRVFGQDSIETALAGDRSYFDRALASGAQIISTDFPEVVPETTFYAEIPGGTPSRCSPATAPAACTSAAIENRP